VRQPNIDKIISLELVLGIKLILQVTAIFYGNEVKALKKIDGVTSEIARNIYSISSFNKSLSRGF